MTYLAEHGIPFVPTTDSGAPVRSMVPLPPSLLVVGTSENPKSPAFELVDAAKQMGTTTVAAVDGPANLAHRFRGETTTPLNHAPDWLLLTEDCMREELEHLGYPPHRMIVTGHPFFDTVRDQGRALLDHAPNELRSEHLPHAPNHRPVIAFLTEGSDGLGLDIKRRSTAYTLNGWGVSNRRTEIVLEEFLDAVDALDDDPYLVLRLHPKETAEAYAAYLSRFDEVSSGSDAWPMLAACDLVVGLSTSLLSEAAIMGLRTMSILPHDGQRHLIVTVRNGLTPCATERRAVHRLLGEQLRADPPSFDLIDSKMVPGATKRAVAALEMLAGEQ